MLDGELVLKQQRLSICNTLPYKRYNTVWSLKVKFMLFIKNFAS